MVLSINSIVSGILSLCLALGMTNGLNPMSSFQDKVLTKHLKKEFNVVDYNPILLDRQVDLGNSVFDKYSIESEELEDELYVWMGSVFTCDLGGCTASKKIEQEARTSSEYFEILLTTDNNNVISSLKVTNYFSDYGYEITANSYTKKYVGKSVCHFSTKDSEVDMISGATISCNALQDAIMGICDAQ